MFVVLISGRIERLEYWWHLAPAISEARQRFKKDGEARRVTSWPENKQLWTTEHETRFTVTADLVADVFGGSAGPLKYSDEDGRVVGGKGVGAANNFDEVKKEEVENVQDTQPVADHQDNQGLRDNLDGVRKRLLRQR